MYTVSSNIIAYLRMDLGNFYIVNYRILFMYKCKLYKTK